MAEQKLVRTELNISREDFKQQVQERIEKGKKLNDSTISSIEQLETNEKSYKKWDDYNKELLSSSFTVVSNKYLQEYSGAGRHTIGVDKVRSGVNINSRQFREWKIKEYLKVKILSLESIFELIDLIPTQIINTENEFKNNSMKSKNVFIIHGHNEEMKKNVQLMLERIGLNAIVLHERPDKGRTIIDKLIEEGAEAKYAIALLSPDDQHTDGSGHARQNVVLEIGYFLGKLGRNNVRLLKKGNTTIPSDLQGILYDDYDTKGGWKVKLAKEMKSVGLEIDNEKLAKLIETF